MKNEERTAQLDVPFETLKNWQDIVDILAELLHVPAALIMRLADENIEVFVASSTDRNPYHPGDCERLLGSGLYCEAVLRGREGLAVPNALADEDWKDNPDIKLGMISYLGFPILLPNGEAFGTICVLDIKEHAYSETHIKLVKKFLQIIQGQLELIFLNAELGEKNKNFSDYVSELKLLRGIIPICAFCKKIRGADGLWKELETYLASHTDAQFSHGCCPQCGRLHYRDFFEDPELNPDEQKGPKQS